MAGGDVTNCLYNKTKYDSNNMPFAPDPTNLMTYGNYECRNHFTQGQTERMHYFIKTSPILIARKIPENIIVSQSFPQCPNCPNNVLITAKNSISTSGNVIIENSADIDFVAEFDITLYPGFEVMNGGDFTAKIGPSCSLSNFSGRIYNFNTYVALEEIKSINLDNNTISAITIYPNPSSGIFTIESEEAINPQHIEVYDIFGKRVLPLINQNGTSATINLENHSKGIYLVRISIFKQKIVLE